MFELLEKYSNFYLLPLFYPTFLQQIKEKLKKSAKPTLFLPRPVTSTQILAEHDYASPDIKV